MSNSLPTDGEWVHGLCQCCSTSAGYCVFSWFCPWCSAGHLACKSDAGACASCCHYFCGGLCLGPRIRKPYGIPGSCCGDCCTTLCCTSCSLTRMKDQLDVPITTLDALPPQSTAPVQVQMVNVTPSPPV
eukprot:Filipodium_phascolosomae@DN7096_c0_g1_i1.p1